MKVYFFCISKDELLQTYKDCHLVLAGDGRCDSPGSSAKLCTYSLMDTATNKILHAETIDKREVNLRSPNMEREGLLRALRFLMAKLHDSVIVDEVITDASTSVRTVLGMHRDWCVCIVQLYVFLQLFHLATHFPEVHHSMDVWHKSKKLKQALTKVNVILANFLFTAAYKGCRY